MGVIESFMMWVSEVLAPYTSPPASTLFILVLSAVITLITLTTNRLMTDMKQFREYSREMRDYLRDLRNAQKSENKRLYTKLKRKEVRIKRIQSLMFRQRFKTFLIFMVPFAILFGILNSVFQGTVAITPLTFPFIEAYLPFFWWYLICSFSISSPLSRLFGLTFEAEDVPVAETSKTHKKQKEK